MENTTKNNRVLFSDDVSILEHARYVVYKDLNGNISALWIDRLEDTERAYIYDIYIDSDLINESWLDFEALNNCMDSDYKRGQTFNDDNDLYMFIYDVCSYYGPHEIANSYAPETMHLNCLEGYLTDLELI